MSRVALGRAAGLLLTLAVVAVAIVWADRTGGDGPSPFRAAPEPTSTPAPQLRLVTRDRSDALRRAALSVVAPAAGRLTVTTTSDVKTPATTLVRARKVSAGRQEVGLGGGAVKALATCGVAGLRLSLSGSGRDATRAIELGDSGPPCGRFFSSRSVYNERVSEDAALDPDSKAIVGELNRQLEANYAAQFGPDINSSDFSTRVYTVPAGQPRVDVALPPSKQAFRAPFDDVPLPPDAKPAEGTDQHLVLYQPSADTVWEFFGLKRQDGRWTTDWGGRIRRASRSDGVVARSSDGALYGATASSLALAAGLITPGDLRRGRIDHALAIAVPQARAGAWALPALRTDGVATGPAAVPEGAHFRLDPKLDLDAMKLPKLTRMLAEAAQRYGLIVRDQSAVVSLYAQIPTGGGGSLLSTVNQGKSDQQVLRAFPWDRLQLLRMDLGG